MSYFNIWFLLFSSLLTPEKLFINGIGQWSYINKEQKTLLKNFSKYSSELSNIRGHELQVWASKNHDELNRIAQQYQVPIVFQPIKAGKFATLSIFNVDLAWINKPVKTQFEFFADKKIVSSKGLEFNQNFKLYTSKTHPYPIVKIETHTGDYVCLSIAGDMKPLDQFALSKKIRNIKNHIVPSKEVCKLVVIPHITYRGFIDTSWLRGICYKNKHHRYTVQDAIEYLKLSCDDTGCSVKAGLAIEFCPISVGMAPLTINRPFYFWIERPGLKCPLIEAYIDIDSIKKDETSSEI